MFTRGVAGVEGTIHRGDRVLSINGTSLSGITHGEALSCLHQTRLPRQALVIIQKGKNTEPISTRQELPLQTVVCPSPGHRVSIREHKTSECLESLSLSWQTLTRCQSLTCWLLFDEFYNSVISRKMTFSVTNWLLAVL